jgi:hypothetical protein
LSSIKFSPCSYELKKQNRYNAEKIYVINFHVLGFTFDEQKRHDKFIKFERSNVLPILIDNILIALLNGLILISI